MSQLTKTALGYLLKRYDREVAAKSQPTAIRNFKFAEGIFV
jgi:hypothetical protein